MSEWIRVAWGGLWLQAAFNPERRQGLGVAAALAPIARTWPREARVRFLRRHLEPFNTNPALAGPLLGALARLEHDAQAGSTGAARRAEVLKRTLESPFAAVGDALLWNGVRPGAAVLAMLLAPALGAGAVVLFVLLYNAVHLGFRVLGVAWGYRAGAEVHRLVSDPTLAAARRWLPAATLLGAWLLAVETALLLPPTAALAALGAASAGVLGGRVGIPRGTLWAVGAIMVGLFLAYRLHGSR